MGMVECKYLYQKANEFLDKQRYSEALAVYKQIIAEYPDSPEAKYSQKQITIIENSEIVADTIDEMEIENEMEMEESLTEILRNQNEHENLNENKGLVTILFALSWFGLLGGLIWGTAFIVTSRMVTGSIYILSGAGAAILAWALGDIVKNLRIIAKKL